MTDATIAPTTLEAWATSVGLTCEAERLDERPPDDGWEDYPGASHWRVTLRRDGWPDGLTVTWSQGSAFGLEPPPAFDVLEATISDAATREGCLDVLDLMFEMGETIITPVTSSRYRAMWATLCAQTDRLIAWCGGSYKFTSHAGYDVIMDLER